MTERQAKAAVPFRPVPLHQEDIQLTEEGAAIVDRMVGRKPAPPAPDPRERCAMVLQVARHRQGATTGGADLYDLVAELAELLGYALLARGAVRQDTAGTPAVEREAGCELDPPMLGALAADAQLLADHLNHAAEYGTIGRVEACAYETGKARDVLRRITRHLGA